MNSDDVFGDGSDGELTLLIPDIDGWAVVAYVWRKERMFYGEHIEGCCREFNGKIPGWCWEHFDAESGEPDSCWVCKAPVPPEIVGMVAMLNWEAVCK